MKTMLFSKTKMGQLVYDLCFTDMTDRAVANRHRIPIVKVRELRLKPAMQRLRGKVLAERISNAKRLVIP